MSEPRVPATWALPRVHGPLVTPRERVASVAALEPPDAEARRRGFEQGYSAGIAAGAAELERERARLAAAAAALESCCETLAAPLRHCDDEAMRELAQLTLGIGSQLARRELQHEPAQLIAIVRECIGLLPAGSRHVRVYLHPLDAAALRERLAPLAQESSWSIVEDPVLARGGCRIQSDSSRIDASFEARVQAVAAALLGEERAAARGESGAA